MMKELERNPVDVETNARARRRGRNALPSDVERRQHEVTHYPFRSWCTACMAGRGVAVQHRARRSAEELAIPSVSFDYCFLRNEPKGISCVTLVCRDRQSRALAAHALPAKGACSEWAVQQIIKDLKKWGHFGQLIMKSD